MHALFSSFTAVAVSFSITPQIGSYILKQVAIRVSGVSGHFILFVRYAISSVASFNKLVLEHSLTKEYKLPFSGTAINKVVIAWFELKCSVYINTQSFH